MGLMDFIKGQFIDVIEYKTDDKRILSHRFDNRNKQIMMGAKLTVRPGQMAIFVNEGQIADIFTEGFYELSTQNMPILTKLKSWKYGFESPFKVDIYFFNMDSKIQQPWGTPSKIPIKDPDFGIIRIGANGYYSFRISDPEEFLRSLVGTDSEYTVNECRPQIIGKIVSGFTDFFAESKVTFFDAFANLEEFSTAVFDKIKNEFVNYGLELLDFTVQQVNAPDNVTKAMDERSTIGAFGGMNMYQQKKMTDAMAEASVKMAGNEGGGMGASAMQMGSGVAMGGMMGGMMGNMMHNTMNPMQGSNMQQQPEMQTISCSKCQTPVASNSKFCPNCGNNMTASKVKTQSCIKCGESIPEGAKFCGECGAKQVAKKAFCKECGKELVPTAKFCPECGSKQ